MEGRRSIKTGPARSIYGARPYKTATLHTADQPRQFPRLLPAKTSHDGPVGPEARRDQVLDANNLRNPTAWAPPRGSTLRVDGACYSAAGRSTAEGAAMVAKVPSNLTPRHPPSQVVDNMPRYVD